MSKLDSEMIKNCPNKGECFCVRDFEEKRRNEFFQEKIKSLEQEVDRLKEENQNLLNLRILDNERLSKRIFKLEEENKGLKEENLKMRNCENCIHYDMVTECELTAITCMNYNKWEIKK